MMRWFFALAAGMAIASVAPAASAPEQEMAASEFSVVAVSLKNLQAAMAAGKVTSRQIVEQYLARIVTYDENLHATLSVNLDAVIDADRLDAERRAGNFNAR